MIVRLLIEAGAEVDNVDENGTTALMVAARTGYTSVARLLIEAGADVHKMSESGYTSLGLARIYDHDLVVSLLLESGAVDDGTALPASRSHTSLRQRLRSGMAILDEHKQCLPEVAYLTLCNALRASYSQSLDVTSHQNSLNSFRES
jgi:ankyrin repeat protein